MSSPAPVLVIDDGELEDVRLLLADLGADFDHLRVSDSQGGIPQPERLLIATARSAHVLRLERTLAGAPNRATWIAFVSGDSKTQRAILQKAGFDFLIREPVHPAALRVLLQRALFKGSDTRRAPRVACGHPIRYRTGFWKKTGTLVDLSPRGCRLLLTGAIKEKTPIKVQIPRELARGKSLTLPGHVVRVTPADREGGVAAEFSVGVRFGELDSRTKSLLRDVLADRVIGPAALAAPLPFTPSTAKPAAATKPTAGKPAATPAAAPKPGAPPQRKTRKHRRGRYRKQVTAVEGGDAYMILCLDISVGGMRIEAVEGLGVGSKLNLAIQLNPPQEPVMVEATVVRDDGENGFALSFDWLSHESRRQIERLLVTLPSIEPLQDEARKQGTILAQRLPRSPRPK